jgi:16S rRNA (cytosine967-C5)-methyltransferase
VELIQNTKKGCGWTTSAPPTGRIRPPRGLAAAFDGVLIDAPCSGLGVMHDKPDIKYRCERAADLEALVALQKRILDACAPYVAPADCCLRHLHGFKGRKRAQGAGFPPAAPEFAPEADASFLPESLRALYSDGMVQLQAHAWDAEGFFIARMPGCGQ